MANLFTHHDPYNVHKIIGTLCLLHYLYRFFNLFVYGQAFGVDSVWTEIGWVALHGVLSLTSMLLPLPQGRNHSAPMIWAEFRVHSILFANRHAVFTILYLLDNAGYFDGVVQALLGDHTQQKVFSKDFDIHETTWQAALLSVTVKAFLLWCVCTIADEITRRLGSKEERTTNSMAYPEAITQEDRAVVKFLYAQRQFYATVWCIYGSPILAFSPMLGIQIAPLMMTFVRKGLISAVWYHRNYALSLQVCYYVLSALFIRAALKGYGVETNELGHVFNGHIAYIMIYGMLTALFTRELCRFYLRLSPQVTWVSNVFIGVFGYRMLLSASENSADFVRGWVALESTNATVPAGGSYLETAEAMHLQYKAQFNERMLDHNGAVSLPQLAFAVCFLRLLQMSVFSTWQFTECLQMTHIGWRTWDSDTFLAKGKLNPAGFLFGELEYFTAVVFAIAFGFAPDIYIGAQLFGAYIGVIALVLLKKRYAAKEVVGKQQEGASTQKKTVKQA